MTADPMPTDDEGNFPDHALKDWLDAELEERRGKVLLLKLSGATYATIARECGVSMSTARKDYQIALQAHMNETPEVGIAKHRAIINDVLRANYPAMLSGDKDAASTILKALDRDAKLKGYDAPTRVLAHVDNRDFANEAARLITRIQQMDPDTLKELTRVHRPQRPILEALEAPAEQPIDVEEADEQPTPARPGADADDPDEDVAPLALADVVVAERRRPARSPGSEGGEVGDAEGLGLQGTLGLEWRERDGGRSVRPAGEVRGDDRRAGADGPAGGLRPEHHDDAPDDLDGWSNIEDD